jgi:hypothetical protein
LKNENNVLIPPLFILNLILFDSEFIFFFLGDIFIFNLTFGTFFIIYFIKIIRYIINQKFKKKLIKINIILKKKLIV